jgi:hypothetical protein
MRLLPAFTVALLMSTTAMAQPAPDEGAGPDQAPPMQQQQMGPQGGPMQLPPMGAHRGPMFDMANTTHDGRLTRDQAQAGGMMHIAQHFDQIDVDHKGYVTKQDIKAWRMAKRQEKAARMQAQQPPAPPPQ